MEPVSIESFMKEEHDNPFFINVHTCTDDLNEDFPTVTKCVRRMYYKYLKNTLLEKFKEVVNCTASRELLTDGMVCCLAKQMELKALNACMVAEIYRKEMLDQINSVKYKMFKSSSDQTVNINVLSVQQINELYVNGNINEKPEAIDRSSPDICMPMDVSGDLKIQEELELMNGKDDIFCKMAEMFNYEEAASLEDIIFGFPETPNMYLDNGAPMPTATNDPTTNDPQQNMSTNSDTSHLSYTTTTVQRSFWQAEEYVQSTILRQHLIAINDLIPDKFNTVMTKFESIFGGDDEDLVSPVNTAVLKTACKDRIGHYVVNGLTLYYKRGQIKTRLLFKLLSRAVVQKIIRYDPYIDGKLIWKSIGEVFDEQLFILSKRSQLLTTAKKICYFLTKLS